MCVNPKGHIRTGEHTNEFSILLLIVLARSLYSFWINSLLANFYISTAKFFNIMTIIIVIIFRQNFVILSPGTSSVSGLCLDPEVLLNHSMTRHFQNYLRTLMMLLVGCRTRGASKDSSHLPKDIFFYRSQPAQNFFRETKRRRQLDYWKQRPFL